MNRAADGAFVQRACPLKRVERFFIIFPIARAGGGRCMVHIKILFVQRQGFWTPTTCARFQ